MGRPSPLDKLHKQISDAYGSRAVTTEKGLATWDRPDRFGMGSNGNDVLGAALRPEYAINFEIPTRDHAQAYAVQEMYAVCSIFSRAIKQLSGDAAQDSMADTQPHTIIINGETDFRKRKIYEILDKCFRLTGLGINTYMRMRRACLTGTCVVQPIFEYDGLRWHLTKAKAMPTWEMHRNPKTDTWKQIRHATMGTNVIAEWNVPGWMGTTMIDEDDNQVYGVPVGQLVYVDYRMMLYSMEDLVVGGRNRATDKIAHYVGQEGRVEITNDRLYAYRMRVQSEPTTIMTDYWLKKGWEEIKLLKGDAAGVLALMKIVEMHQRRMRRAIGLPADPEALRGRGLESVDADYARNINILRMADSKCLKSIGDKALRLEGYKDIDWSTQIPPIGETESNRTTRASNELRLGHIGIEEYCAIAGHKNPEKLLKSIEAWIKFCKKNDIPIGGATSVPSLSETQPRQKRLDTPGTESPSKGADPQKGRGRRKQQRTAGRTPTGA